MSARLIAGSSQLGDHETRNPKTTSSTATGKANTTIGRRVQAPRKNGTPAKKTICGRPSSSAGYR